MRITYSLLAKSSNIAQTLLLAAKAAELSGVSLHPYLLDGKGRDNQAKWVAVI